MSAQLPDDAYLVDPQRAGHTYLGQLGAENTGIFVRAFHAGKFGSFDIAELTRHSLLAWLCQKGGNNEWAQRTVLLLLGHQ